MAETTTYSYKLVVVGDPSVGKTSLIRRYANKKFEDSYLPTIGADFTIKQIDLKEGNAIKQIMLQIWDMGGQRMFERIKEHYLVGANAGLVVFDLTRRETFENIDNWLKDIDKLCGKIPCIILANKSDLSDRIISQDELTTLASDKKVEIFETSAKSGKNVDHVFELIAKTCVKSYDSSSKQ
ncbi:MAG: GTP-binding protein [Candidatus Helarchaeota archaeon]|nr:GTP-binding protein [Candidatus Helarchaeota archaeon]